MTKMGFTNLELARRCRGETGQQFGVHCGVDSRFISRAECGRGMSDLHLARVVEYLGWKGDPRELLEQVPEPKKAVRNA